MKKFIFLTNEGFTLQPHSEDYEPDIENMQVIGFGEGGSVDGALENMLEHNSYIEKTTFNKVYGIEIKDDRLEVLFLNRFRNT